MGKPLGGNLEASARRKRVLQLNFRAYLLPSADAHAPLRSESEACVEPNRQYWSDQQQHFRRLLLRSDRHTDAIDAFLQQHAMLHTASLAPGSRWSFQHQISADLTDQQLRQIPSARLHSIAWLIWHIARTEDVTSNLLLANTDQLLFADHWFEHLATPTREIVQKVTGRELRQRVEGERIERVKAEGALVPAAYGVAEYWGRHTKGNLLLVPATRHSFTHLNEAGRVRHKLRR